MRVTSVLVAHSADLAALWVLNMALHPLLISDSKISSHSFAWALACRAPTSNLGQSAVRVSWFPWHPLKFLFHGSQQAKSKEPGQSGLPFLGSKSLRYMTSGTSRPMCVRLPLRIR